MKTHAEVDANAHLTVEFCEIAIQNDVYPQYRIQRRMVSIVPFGCP